MNRRVGRDDDTPAAQARMMYRDGSMPNDAASDRPRLRAVEAESNEAPDDSGGRGDAQTWAELYASAYPSVYKHVCCLCGSPSIAEDLTQEAFSSAFSSIGDFDGRGSFVAWVRGIALNLVRMHWRSHASTDRAHASLSELQAVAPPRPGEDPERVLVQLTRMQALYRVLDELPAHLREVFILRDVEGLSAGAIGETLGITANNVRVRANRARSKVRAALVRHGHLSGSDS